MRDCFGLGPSSVQGPVWKREAWLKFDQDKLEGKQLGTFGQKMQLECLSVTLKLDSLVLNDDSTTCKVCENDTTPKKSHIHRY